MLRPTELSLLALLLATAAVTPGPAQAEVPTQAAAAAGHTDGRDLRLTAETPNYLISAGDTLHIFVWKNPDLTLDAPVRPDGRITVPLVQDLQADGKTPTELAADLRTALTEYVQDPVVTVVVKTFASPANAAAIRVIGAAVTPKTVPFRSGLTALDVMIEVGGLNNFANGNRAQLIRRKGAGFNVIPLHLADLVRSGDLRRNIPLMPGDVIRIPERWF